MIRLFVLRFLSLSIIANIGFAHIERRPFGSVVRYHRWIYIYLNKKPRKFFGKNKIQLTLNIVLANLVNMPSQLNELQLQINPIG